MEPISMGSPMHTMLERWSERFFIAAVFLFPIVVIPVEWFPFALVKLSLCIALLTISLLLAVYTSYVRGGFSLPRNAVFIAVLALPVTYLISALFSQNPLLSYIGSGTEENTVFFAGVSALIVVIAGLVLRSRSAIRSSLMALFYALCVVAVFQALQIFFGFGALVGLASFSSKSANLFGSWNDLGLSMGLLATLAMVFLDGEKMQRGRTVLHGVLLALSLIILAVINLDVAWQVLAGVALVSALLTVSLKKNDDPLVPSKRKVPAAALAVLIISVCFVAWGNQINAKLSSYVSVSELEVRPALSTTRDIVVSTLKQSPRTAIVGTGPGTFIEQWLMYKPTSVNSTQFWNVDFSGGSGMIPTAFVTTGLLGGVTWVALFLLLLWVLFRVAVRGRIDPSLRPVFTAATLGALFLLVASALYLSGEMVLVALFVLIGVALSAERLSSMKEWVVPLAHTPGLQRVPGYLVVVALLAGSLAVLGFGGQRLLAAVHVGRALAAQTGDFDMAKAQAQKALAITDDENTLRLLSAITFAQAQAISKESASADQATRFQQTFAESMKYAQDAVARNPRNYQNRVAVAQLFEALIPLKVDGAYANAKQNYKEAIRLNPYNPGLFLAAARTEAEGGNENDFKSAIQTAFTLKPNFTEAALLVLQVEIARNNIDGAIVAAQVAAVTAPQNPGIYFELGLLKYVKGDASGAKDALEQALKLAPDYANAKYFLGLTYNRLNRNQEGIALFEDLQKSNPDNAEVALILGNMKAGKDPFAGAQPPATPKVEDRKTPPIAE